MKPISITVIIPQRFQNIWKTNGIEISKVQAYPSDETLNTPFMITTELYITIKKTVFAKEPEIINNFKTGLRSSFPNSVFKVFYKVL